MELTQEQYEGLPDYAKDGFAASEDGKFLPVKDAALKTTLDNLDKEKKQLESKVSELTVSEQERLAQVEAAKAEARDEAIKEAASKGNWEEQERLLREKFNDELKRELQAERENVTKELTIEQSRKQLESDVKLLAERLTARKETTGTLETVLKARMGLDEAGNRIYKGGDGSAMAIDDLGKFEAELQQDSGLLGLIKGKPKANGGGLLDGGSGSGSAIAVPDSLEACKGDKSLEAAYFNSQMGM